MERRIERHYMLVFDKNHFCYFGAYTSLEDFVQSNEINDYVVLELNEDKYEVVKRSEATE